MTQKRLFRGYLSDRYYVLMLYRNRSECFPDSPITLSDNPVIRENERSQRLGEIIIEPLGPNKLMVYFCDIHNRNLRTKVVSKFSVQRVWGEKVSMLHRLLGSPHPLLKAAASKYLITQGRCSVLAYPDFEYRD